MKVPPAKELNTISTMLLVSLSPKPIAMPIGVASANKTLRYIAFYLSWSYLNLLLRDMPSDIAAGPL